MHDAHAHFNMCLQSSDAALVRSMESKARELVRAAVGDDFDERELALGFHWPPWYSVCDVM